MSAEYREGVVVKGGDNSKVTELGEERTAVCRNGGG